MYTISCGAFREQLWTGIQGQTRQKSLHQSQKHQLTGLLNCFVPGPGFGSDNTR